MELLHIKLSAELKERLRAESKNQGLSMSAFARLVILEKLSQLKGG